MTVRLSKSGQISRQESPKCAIASHLRLHSARDFVNLGMNFSNPAEKRPAGHSSESLMELLYNLLLIVKVGDEQRRSSFHAYIMFSNGYAI